MLVVLIVGAGFVWTRVFETVGNVDAATQCPMPAPAAPGAPPPVTGQMQSRDALDRTSPVPPQDIQVRVLNGNGERRQAALVSEELTGLGFAPAGADNDPVYTRYDLKCHGQIRYGATGAGAARTLSLVVPCVQLVRDGRQDPSVDLALGSRFDDIRATAEAKQILQQLKNWVPQRDQQGSSHQEVSNPPIDSDLMEKARDVTC